MLSIRLTTRLSIAFGLSAALSACSSSTPTMVPALHVPAAPPPKDDGKPAQGGAGGAAHAAALEQLKIAPLAMRGDKQNSVRILLPDADNWTRVRFWTVPSLVGFRYGKDHHAIVAAFTTQVEDPSQPGACMKAFEAWAKPFVDAFEVEIQRDAPRASVWNTSIADIESVFAKTATLASRETYAATYATYPAWKGSCLVVGVAIPSRDESGRAKEVRDRFAKDVLTKVEVLAKDEPKERY